MANKSGMVNVTFKIEDKVFDVVNDIHEEAYRLDEYYILNRETDGFSIDQITYETDEGVVVEANDTISATTENAIILDIQNVNTDSISLDDDFIIDFAKNLVRIRDKENQYGRNLS